MSDLLQSVSQVRKSFQKKRQQRNKDLSLNFTPLSILDNDRSKTERNLRLRSNNAEKSQISEKITSPLLPKRFEFIETLTSPSRDQSKSQFRSYKIDAVKLLVGRVKCFLNKHFLIWKKNTEFLRHEENSIFRKKAWRLKVSVGKQEFKPREVARPQNFAGKIVRQSQDNIAKYISKITAPINITSDEETPIIEVIQETKKSQTSSLENMNFSPQERSLIKSQTPSQPPPIKNYIKAATSIKNFLRYKISQKLRDTFNKLLIPNTIRKSPETPSIYQIPDISDSIINPHPISKTSESPVESQFNHSSPNLSRMEGMKSFSNNDSKISENPSQEKSSHREAFEGRMQNIKNFLSEKREKKTRNMIYRQNSGILRISVEKLVKSLNFGILSLGFRSLKQNTSDRVGKFAGVVEKVGLCAVEKVWKDAFERVLEYPNIRKTNEKILKALMKNLSKDYKYRLGTSFNFWRTTIIKSKKDQEFFSLSVVSIHGILQNIINCRTKTFFSTYKLAMIKYLQFNQDRFKNISKGLYRLNLCLRDYKIKPFLIWKSYTQNYKTYIKSIKKYIFRIERNINSLIRESIRENFALIIIFIKKKQSAIRVFTKLFARSLKRLFEDFKFLSCIPKVHKKKLRTTFQVSAGQSQSKSIFCSQSMPKRFSYKFLCHAIYRLTSNIGFHHTCLKKNTMIKWKMYCTSVKRVQLIKMRYDRELSHAFSCSMLLKTINMIIISSLRFSFIKVLKY
ncbi:hypothetical protein SteCoe_12581 [Stentor coeruleus]|uniref:Uncharacterized protein n=1 Tax=Stentor coeruleus TaxID=5963 RepID=A0A1R2CAJ1_9CILI|nr:hypothetical protein SteCoe_12581 [Stentor coeruleus]